MTGFQISGKVDGLPLRPVRVDRSPNRGDEVESKVEHPGLPVQHGLTPRGRRTSHVASERNAKISTTSLDAEDLCDSGRADPRGGAGVRRDTDVSLKVQLSQSPTYPTRILRNTLYWATGSFRVLFQPDPTL